jgi:hypothetical protein
MLNQKNIIDTEGFSHKQAKLLVVAVYVMMGIGLLLPAEKIELANATWQISLWHGYSGQALGVSLTAMLLLEFFWHYRKQNWLLWPGLLAGLHATTFAILRIQSLQMIGYHHKGSLAQSLASSASPGAGLYILLAGGMVLIVLHGWLLIARKKRKPATMDL